MIRIIYWKQTVGNLFFTQVSADFFFGIDTDMFYWVWQVLNMKNIVEIGIENAS